MRETKVVIADSAHIGDDILCSTTPVIIKGLIKHWPLVEDALKGQSKLQTTLLTHYNQRPVISYQTSADNKGRYFYNEDCTELNFTKESLSLDVFFEKVTLTNKNAKAPSIFVPSMHLDTYFPELKKQLVLDIDGVTEPLMQAWLGTPSTISCHFDAMKNLACCVSGKRRFTLFPPDQVDNLYIGPVDLTPAGQAISLVDMANPDFDKHPKFANALEAGEEAILEPGDALYLPSMWWHQVEGLEPFNLMINYWWRTTPRILGEPMAALEHAMLSIRALPLEERKAWQAMFNHYIFAQDAENPTHISKSAQGKLAPLDDKAARRLRAHLLSALNR